MKEERRYFYRVITSDDLWDLRLPDPLEYGYEDKRTFKQAIQRLTERWQRRVGEGVGARHKFILLRFCDSVGGMREEAWMPNFLLKPIPMPDHLRPQERNELEEEINETLGFE